LRVLPRHLLACGSKQVLAKRDELNLQAQTFKQQHQVSQQQLKEVNRRCTDLQEKCSRSETMKEQTLKAAKDLEQKWKLEVASREQVEKQMAHLALQFKELKEKEEKSTEATEEDSNSPKKRGTA